MTVPIHVDHVEGAGTCLVSFGGHNSGINMARPEFDRATAGLVWSRIFVVDTTRSFYQRGIGGTIDTPGRMFGEIERHIRAINPDRVVVVGACVGGFFALQAGPILDADRVVTFGGLTTLSREGLDAIDDHRWDHVLQSAWALGASSPWARWREIRWRGLGDDLGIDIEMHVGDDSKDQMHAERLDGVTIKRWPGAGHIPAKWLRDRDMLEAVIRGE